MVIGITLWVALRRCGPFGSSCQQFGRAAQKIADGDLSARVSEDNVRADEVGFLSQSFNRMTERLQSQTGTLLATNHQLDERRAFIEAVLESVSAGVISASITTGAIQLANSTAEKMLLQGNQSIIGKKFRSVSPVLADIGRRAAARRCAARRRSRASYSCSQSIVA